MRSQIGESHVASSMTRHQLIDFFQAIFSCKYTRSKQVIPYYLRIYVELIEK